MNHYRMGLALTSALALLVVGFFLYLGSVARFPRVALTLSSLTFVVILGPLAPKLYCPILRRGLVLGFGRRVHRGVSYVQASQDLNVHPSQLRDWVKKLSEDPQHAFPGHGQMKPEQLEIVRLKREVAKLKAERDILKKAAAYFAKEST